MENLFNLLGYDWKTLPINEFIDTSEKKVSILSYDHIENKNIPSIVEGIIRKEDQDEYVLENKKDSTLNLRCASTHKVYVNERGYITAEELINQTFPVLNKDNSVSYYTAFKTGNKIPVIDVQMDNGCYFSNGILSHNTGGNALKFYASVRMDVRRIETLTKGEDAVGARIKVKVVKNKVAPPFKKAEFDLYFDNRGLDKPSQILDSAVAMNFVKKSGAWFSYGDNRIGQGRENTATYLRENPDLCKELETKIRTALANGESVKEIVVQDKETKSSEEVA